MKDHKWASHFFISWIVDNQVLYTALPSLAYTTFKPHNYLQFLWNAPAVLCLIIFGTFEAIVIAQRA
jgi:hypothetical protein